MYNITSDVPQISILLKIMYNKYVLDIYIYYLWTIFIDLLDRQCRKLNGIYWIDGEYLYENNNLI